MQFVSRASINPEERKILSSQKEIFIACQFSSIVLISEREIVTAFMLHGFGLGPLLPLNAFK